MLDIEELMRSFNVVLPKKEDELITWESEKRPSGKVQPGIYNPPGMPPIVEKKKPSELDLVELARSFNLNLIEPTIPTGKEGPQLSPREQAFMESMGEAGKAEGMKELEGIEEAFGPAEFIEWAGSMSPVGVPLKLGTSLVKGALTYPLRYGAKYVPKTMRNIPKWGAAGMASEMAASQVPEEHPLLKFGVSLLPLAVVPAGKKALLEPLTGEAGAVGFESARQEGIRQTFGERAWEALEPLREKISKQPLLPQGPLADRISEYLGGRTLNEWFLSATERAGPQAQKMLRKAQAMKGTAASVIEREIQPLMREAKPEELVDMLRWGASEGKILPKDEGSLNKIFKLETAFEDVLKKPITSKPAKRELMESTFQNEVKKIFDVEDDALTVLKERFRATGVNTMDDAYRYLGELIESPLIPNDLKRAAMSVYDLPARLPEEVYKAYSEATYKVLSARVKENKRWFSPNLREGFIASKQPGLKGMYIRKDIDDAFVELNYVTNRSQALHKYLLAPWKMLKVVLRVPAQMRNVFGNFMLNDTASVNPLSWYTPNGVKTYAEAMKHLTRGSKQAEWFSRLTGIDMTTFIGGDVGKYMLPKRYGDNMMDGALRFFHKAANMTKLPQLYQFNEKWAKFAKYLHNKEKGMSDLDAAIEAVDATFNYNDVSIFTRRMRESVLPFFSWQSKVFRQLPERMVKHPIRMAKYAIAPAAITAYAVEKVGMSKEEWRELNAAMPEYMKKGWLMLLPFRDDQGRLSVMNMTWLIPGLGDIHEVYGGITEPSKTFLQNPFLNLYAAIKGNVDPFTNRPLSYEWEDPGTQFLKKMMYVYKQFTPSFFPGNTDFDMLWRSIARGEPDYLSPGQAIISQFGFKVSPLDPDKIYENEAAIQNVHRQQIYAERNRELRRAVSAEEEAEIEEKFEKVIEGEYEED